MAIAIPDDPRALAESVQGVRRSRNSVSEARCILACDTSELPAFWEEACDLGWLGLAISERFGGQGASPSGNRREETFRRLASILSSRVLGGSAGGPPPLRRSNCPESRVAGGVGRSCRGADAVERLVLEEELGELPRQSLGLGGGPAYDPPSRRRRATRPADVAQSRRTPPLVPTLQRARRKIRRRCGDNQSQSHRRRVGVNGQKVWTSDARNCQIGLATVRTDTELPKHAGITAMAVEMDAPGVEVISGPATVLGDETEWSRDSLFTRCLIIAGGTSEIARNQIAQRMLGLPREP